MTANAIPVAPQQTAPAQQQVTADKASAPPLSAVTFAPVTANKSVYITASRTFTQQGPGGITFDFNDGARVRVPTGNYRVEIRDVEANHVLYRMPMSDTDVASYRKYFIPFGIRVWKDDELFFEHAMDLKGKKVLIQFPKGSIIGDSIAWFTYAARFAKQHECDLTVSMGPVMTPLFRDAHPGITFKKPEEINPSDYYATYYLGLFFDDVNHHFEPINHRHAGLHKTAANILGIDTLEEPPAIAISEGQRPIPEKYVVIAVQASTQCKRWNYPGGWMEIVRFLKEQGYRVICIDKDRTHDVGLMRNHIPHGCEDETGERSLVERAHWLRHAEFFIGVSSGLAWLAWAAGTPVVMISGFTLPTNEFYTPYRVFNRHVCNGCWNDQTLRFDNRDFMWCPRKADTPEQFQCSTSITPQHVKNVIRSIPGFGVTEKL